MRTLIKKLPDGLGLEVIDLKMSMATKLYDLCKITTGQGAKIVGIFKRAFTELVDEYGVSLFGYTSDELTK